MLKSADNILTRGYDTVSNYLHSVDSTGNPLRDRAGNLTPTDFTPGYLGAAVGTGLGALTTAVDPDESPADRAKRTIRNALLGGVLGGVGAQTAVGGFGAMSDAVSGAAPAGQPDKSEMPGFGSSPLMRTLYSLTGSGGARRFLRTKWKNEDLNQLFSGKNLEIRDSDAKNILGPWQPGEGPIPGKSISLPEILEGESRGQYNSRVLQFLREASPKGFDFQNGSTGVPVANAMAYSIKNHGGGQGFTEAELTNRFRWMGLKGEGDSAIGTALRRGANAASLTGYAPTHLRRAGGLVGTALSVGLPWIAPDLANNVFRNSAGKALQDTVMGSAPNFGKSPIAPAQDAGDWLTEGSSTHDIARDVSNTARAPLDKVWNWLAR